MTNIQRTSDSFRFFSLLDSFVVYTLFTLVLWLTSYFLFQMAAAEAQSASVDIKAGGGGHTVMRSVSAVVTTPSAAEIEQYWDRLGAFRTSKYVPWSAQKIALDIRMITYSNRTQELIDLSRHPNHCGAIGLVSNSDRRVTGLTIPGLTISAAPNVVAVAPSATACCS